VSFLVGALMPKNLELLRELVPKSTTFGVLVNPNYPDTNVHVRNAQAAAQELGGRLVVANEAVRVNWIRLSQSSSTNGLTRL